MHQTANPINDTLQEILNNRKEEHLYRSLQVNDHLIDFCSNDYLGFARLEKIKQKVKKYSSQHQYLSGATGSRSISGNTSFVEDLEKQIAGFHQAQAGLIFNSGYDANIGLFSSIAGKNDTIVCDELIHASIIDGCRLSYANRFRFAHNDANDLEKKLKQAKGNIFVAVESLYSMDGDIAPLGKISEICKKYNANLIVDEAHATGVFGRQGRGLVNHFCLEKDVFARVHTFGKTMGCHGAIVVGNDVLRNYLINFSRSFIFTTALPIHSLITIKCAYEELAANDFNNSPLHKLIGLFRNGFYSTRDVFLIDSFSPIQSVVIAGNERVRHVSVQLQEKGFDVRAIISPSVPVGKERLRISLHLHNTTEQVERLLQTLKDIFCV